jgi:hypothetical protein
VPGLDPHLAARRLLGAAAGAAGGLHQQRKQAFGSAEIAAEQCTVRVDRRDQGHAPEVVALGDHLGADQHVDLAFVDRAKLLLEAAGDARAVGIDAGHPRAGCRTPGRPEAPAP